jgi:UDP-N-acetylmuramoyl-tripeptide--D-alanyl-D-alanine ligase
VAEEIRLTAAWVAEAMAGTIVGGDSRQVFAGVSIDSRTLRAGELYVGIRGARFDGGDFASTAVAAGAAGVVVAREPAKAAADPGGRPMAAAGGAPVVIAVDDTTVALQALAHAVRTASGTKVVAITGSAGKTTTKEVTAEFLGARYRVIRNRGNFNNHIGLPLSLIELTARPEVAVVELGMNHAGEISTLVGIAEPDVRVWTNVGDAHVGFFGSADAIADAKAEILEGATAATVLVANADDERIVRRIASFAGRRVTFGIERPADVRAEAVVDRGIDGMTARVTTRRGSIDLTTPLVGSGNLANVLAAVAVGIEFDVPLATMADLSSRLRPASRRGEVVRLAKGVVVIDDSYNASPAATRRALEVIRTTVGAGRKIAVLGEMLELGDRAIALHEDVGRAAAAARLDVLLAVGGAAAGALVDAAVAGGLARERTRHVATSDEAADVSASLVRPGDLVLVKGSRGVRTDKVVDRLKAEFA